MMELMIKTCIFTKPFNPKKLKNTQKKHFQDILIYVDKKLITAKKKDLIAFKQS